MVDVGHHGVEIAYHAAHGAYRPPDLVVAESRDRNCEIAGGQRSVRSLATGDLTIAVPTFGNDEIGRTVSAMGSMVRDLHAMVTNIHHDGESLTTQANGVAVAADKLYDFSAKLHGTVGQIKEDALMVLSSTTTTLERLHEAANTAQHTSLAATK